MNTGGRAFGSLHFHPRLEIQILSAEKFQVSNLEIIVHTDAGAPLIEEFTIASDSIKESCKEDRLPGKIELPCHNQRSIRCLFAPLF